MRDPRLTRQHRPYVDELDTPGYNVMILPALEADSAHTRPLGDSESPQSTERQRRVIGSTLRRTRSIRERHKTMDEHGAAQQLKFEMISCDGGSLDLDDSGRYEAENLLRNDSSVYCTAKLENVNVILKGIAGRPFALSKLVIKAPQRSFTSPVKDGLVFVSMERIQVEDTGCYDRSELCSPDLPAHLEGCHSDLHRLLVSKELPSSTTELEDTAIPAHIIRPSAYFVIDERLGNAIINFDPPISGRYVLLKLLSGQPFDSGYPGRLAHLRHGRWLTRDRFERDNIDIQAVLLYGFTGRMIFPKFELR